MHLSSSSFSFKGHVYTPMFHAGCTTLSLALKGFVPVGTVSCKASINHATREVHPKHWSPRRFRKGSTAGKPMEDLKASCLALLGLSEGGLSLSGEAKLREPRAGALRTALGRYAGTVNAKQEGSW